MDISVYTIDRKIVRNDVAKGINKGLRSEMKGLLLGSTPNWVVDRVLDFTSEWMPFVRMRGSKRDGSEKSGYAINDLEESSDDAADRVQEFLGLLEEDLRGALAKRRTSSEGESDVGKGEKEAEEIQERIRQILELVERVVTSLFYERFVALLLHCHMAYVTWTSDCSCNQAPTTPPTTKHLQAE